MKKIIIIPFLILILSLNSSAQGDLLITPRRVVFEGSKQKESLSLVNIGKDTATYTITFVQRKMNEDGSFVNIEKPDSGQMFADPYLRIFPRKVTLAPGEPQVIVVQLRKSADLASGEYRSHLYFRSEKIIKPLGMEKNNSDSTLASVQITPIFGMSIPIIIRTGVVSVISSLSDLKLETQNDSIRSLKLTLNRSGNISLYGNLTVEYLPLQGKPVKIGAMNGVGVYTNLTKRNVTVKLNNTQGLDLGRGKLKVSFTSSDDGVKKEIYSTGELELP